MNNRYLVPALELAPLSYERLLKLLPEDRLDIVSPENRFTAREVVAHLADVEDMILGRLKAAVESPGTQVDYFDEDQRAIDLEYSHSDIWEQLEVFKARRRETIAYVQGIQDWSGWIIHPEQGKMTASDVIHTFVGHDHYHIEHLTHLLVD
jgi:hypothetical protein